MGQRQAGWVRVGFRRAGSGSSSSGSGVTSIIAGTNVTISSTGPGGTGDVTVNATVPNFSAVYAAGAAAANQTATILDAKGGAIVLDGTNAGNTVGRVLTLKGTGGLTDGPMAIDGGDVSGRALRLLNGANQISGEGAGGLNLFANGVWSAATNGTIALQIDANSNLALGFQNPLLTSATNGFPFTRTMPGAPTGALAASYGTAAPNMSARVWNTTNLEAWNWDPIAATWYPSGSIANWSTAGIRVYAVDFVNGNDAHKGFADSADLTAGNYATACAAAGAVAKKTLAGLGKIFPRDGAQRTVEIVIANAGAGAVQAYADDLSAVLGGVIGYATLAVRGTGTNATAGATAFDGSAADCVYMGAATAPGMNAAGYNPIGGPTTTVVQCQKAGGGAAGFAAEAAATMPLGARIRFDAATTTAALRNVCRQVGKVTGGDTLTFASALPAVPAGTDVFYIEQPGVTTTAITLGNSISSASSASTWQIAGIGSGALNNFGTQATYAFCWPSTVSARNCLSVWGSSYTHPVRSTTTPGGSRSSGATFAYADSFCSIVALHIVGNYSQQNATAHTATALVVGGNVTMLACYLLNNGAAFGGTAALASIPPRVLNGVVALNGGGSISWGQLEINSPTSCIVIQGNGQYLDLSIAGANASMTGAGAAGFGLNLQSGSPVPYGAIVKLDGANLPAYGGSIANIGIANGAFATLAWAKAGASGGFADYHNNTFFPKATGQGQAHTKWSGTLFGGSGASATYFADVGALQLANFANPLDYPGTGFQAVALRIFVSANTMANAVTVALQRRPAGGASGATAISINVPAGNVGYFSVASDGSGFQDGDTYDLKASSPGPDVGDSISLSATLAIAASP